MRTSHSGKMFYHFLNRNFLVFTLFIALMGAAIEAYGAKWYDSAWEYRRKIAIAGDLTSATLTNFPYLVQITNANDAVFSHAQASGEDLLFTAENGTDLLDFEIEFYTNAPIPRLTAWVRIPVLSNGCSTVFCMYYGNSNATSVANAGGVWDEHFKMVQHLEETGTGTRYDSTTNQADSTAVANFDGDESVLGLIGRSLKLNSDLAQVITIDQDVLDMASNITFEIWMENITGQTTNSSAAMGAKYTSISIQHFARTNRVYISCYTEENTSCAGESLYLPMLPWYQATATYDGAHVNFYINGKLYKTQAATGAIANPVGDWAKPWRIGTTGYKARFWNGMLDEARISSTVRSAAWIKASYDNQYTPDLHMTIGPEHGRLPSDRWRYCQTITISSNLVDSVLTNFPLFVQITNAANAVFAEALPDGSDIYFTLSGSEARLDHEFEYYIIDETPRLDAWVRIPLLPADTDTDLHMFYGNPAAAAQQNAGGVWDEHFKMVQHFNETGSGVRYDSTLNNADSTSHNLTGDEVIMGILGRALEMDGTGDDIIVVDNDILDLPTNITMEAWIQLNLASKRGTVLGQSYQDHMLCRHASASPWYAFTVVTNTTKSSISYATWVASSVPWTHMAITYDGSQGCCFENGSVVHTKDLSGERLDYTRHWRIGSRGEDTELAYEGHLDEIRISDIARSETWMSASFNNQYTPSDYLTFGKQKNLVPIGTHIFIR